MFNYVLLKCPCFVFFPTALALMANILMALLLIFSCFNMPSLTNVPVIFRDFLFYGKTALRPSDRGPNVCGKCVYGKMTENPKCAKHGLSKNKNQKNQNFLQRKG